MKTEAKTLITRNQYMDNSKELHHAYYSQFVTESTKQFVLRSLSIKQIRRAIDSGDKWLNKIRIPYNNMGSGGGWWWDGSPVNVALMREAGEIGPNSMPSPSSHTCVGKAAARMLAKDDRLTIAKKSFNY